MQKNEVKNLIESIKSKTEQLKNTVRNCVNIKKPTATSPNSHETSIKAEFSTKRNQRKKLTHEISEVLLRNDEHNLNYQENYQNNKAFEENQDLKIDVSQLKKALLALMEKYKLLKKELEEEKRKNLKFGIIEQEYYKEKKKNQMMNEKNFEVKKQALSLVNKIKGFLNAREKEDNEALQESIAIATENDYLKSLLQKPDLEQATPQKDSKSLQSKPPDLQSFRETYKKIKEERKEMKEKQKLDEKSKEKTSKIFNYFQSASYSQSDLLEQNAIIDMYEEKILQNSLKGSMSSSSSKSLDKSLDKSPKLSSLANLKRKEN